MSYTYQWERCDSAGANCVDIVGATAETYVAQAADVGHTLCVRVNDGTKTVVSSPTGVVTSTPPPPPPATTRWFADTAWVNLVVPTTPTIDPNNSAWQSLMHNASIWTNGIQGGGAWSATVYYSDGTEPSKGPFALAVPGGSFTFPHFGASWVPSPGDGHIIIVNPDGSYIETQGVDLSAMTIHSVARGNVATGNAVYTIPDTAPYTTVAPVPDAAGLILASEINGGSIPHAIRCAIPWASSAFVFPAHNSDGGTSGGIPTGKRLWLPRSADLSSLSTTPQRTVATAMQEYGIVIADSGGSFSIPVESTADGSSYPFTSLSFPSAIVNQLMVLAGNGAMA